MSLYTLCNSTVHHGIVVSISDLMATTEGAAELTLNEIVKIIVAVISTDAETVMQYNSHS